jgi:hypothetical protein
LELNDAVVSDSWRGLRGGAWNLFGYGGLGYDLRSSTRGDIEPFYEYLNIGFRVASVPEPTSMVLTMLASGMMLIRRKR